MNRSSNKLLLRATAGLAGALLSLAGMPHAQEAQDGAANPSRIQMQRQHPEAYKGGQPIVVRLDVSASTWEGLTAIGIYEKIPEGWVLASVDTIAGPAPGIAPEPGAGGLLEFIWISPPRAPVSLQYELQIPPRDSGIRNFSGQVEYRLDRGKQVSNIALTQLDGEADELPVIRLRGTPDVTLDEGEPFTDPGATATDQEDGDLTGKIQTTGEVDTGQPGRYEIIYQVEDSAGNRADPARRTVTVRAESGTNGDTPGRGGGQPGGAPRPRSQPGSDPARDPETAPAAEQPTGFPRAWLAGLEPEFGEDRPDFDLPLADREGSSPSDRSAAGEEPVTGRTRGPDAAPAVVGSTKPVSGTLAEGAGDMDKPPMRATEGGRLLLAIGAIVSVSVAVIAWWGVLGKRRRRRIT